MRMKFRAVTALMVASAMYPTVCCALPLKLLSPSQGTQFGRGSSVGMTAQNVPQNVPCDLRIEWSPSSGTWIVQNMATVTPNPGGYVFATLTPPVDPNGGPALWKYGPHAAIAEEFVTPQNDIHGISFY